MTFQALRHAHPITAVIAVDLATGDADGLQLIVAEFEQRHAVATAVQFCGEPADEARHAFWGGCGWPGRAFADGAAHQCHGQRFAFQWFGGAVEKAVA